MIKPNAMMFRTSKKVIPKTKLNTKDCARCHDHPFDRWTPQQVYEVDALCECARLLC